MKKIQAINDHVVVKEILPSEKTTDSGLVIPQTVKTEPQKYGIVLSIGSDVNYVKVGDVVVFHQAGGQVVILNGEIIRILKNNEIYGIMKEE